MNEMTYALITPARNEEAFIGETLRSVARQTIKPERWIIVSDGSTDKTDSIVESYIEQHSWIELIRKPERRDRNFAAKAESVNMAFDRLRELDFEIVGNLDADVSFGPDYFEYLLGKFASNPELGVAGTPYIEDGSEARGHSCASGHANLAHVSGPCQLFRRGCFEAIGGYRAMRGGAIDWVAVTTARMRGWETRTFPDRTYWHHRKMGTAQCGPLRARFQYGQKAYRVGGHPVWEVIRGGAQMRERPWIVGGSFFLAGYLWSLATRAVRPVPNDLIAFHRKEQMTRLKGILGKAVGKFSGGQTVRLEKS